MVRELGFSCFKAVRFPLERNKDYCALIKFLILKPRRKKRMVSVQPLYVDSPLLELALSLTRCQTPEEVVKLALQELVRYRQPLSLSFPSEARQQSLLAGTYSTPEEELWLANQDETGWQ
jgi:hypothetical protein